MRLFFGFRSAIVLVGMIAAASMGRSQCVNEIKEVPLGAFKSAKKPRDFARFRYSMKPGDELLIRSHEDQETELGPYDTGFEITRSGRVLQRVSLKELPQFRQEDEYFSESFTTMAVSRVCRVTDPVYFVTMQYTGDMLSPALMIALVPSDDGYSVVPFPMTSGGVYEVSIASPLHVRTWDNLNEGDCNACKTAYRVTDYEIREGKPARLRRFRTRHLYDSGDARFNDRRIRFLP